VRLRRRERPAVDRRGPSVGDRTTGGGRNTLLLGAALVVLALTLIASLAVLPVQTFLGQGDEIGRLSEELERLESVNAELVAEVSRLRTDEGVREAARDQLGYVGDGERRETIVAAEGPPTDLPTGWPYGTVRRIVELRLGAP